MGAVVQVEAFKIRNLETRYRPPASPESRKAGRWRAGLSETAPGRARDEQLWTNYVL